MNTTAEPLGTLAQALDHAARLLSRDAAAAAEQAAEIIARDPAYIGQTRTTCVATMLAGGHATNALPQSATANVNCRIFPGDGIDDVRKALQSVVGKDIDVKLVGEPLFSDPSPLREDLLGAVSHAVRRIHPDVPVVPQQIAGATDGLVFRRAGIPTYGVDGNFMKTSDDFSHGLNERMPLSNIRPGITYYLTVLKELAAK